jgi:hypothetical protein
MKIINLTKKDREQAEAFADKRCGDSALYKQRGAFKREDIVVGALSEIAVYKLLREAGRDVSKPDFAIYETRKKSYEADLCDSQRHFHVKGQGRVSAKRYGISWLFQKSDKIVKEPVLNHYIVPTNVDLDSNEVTVYGIISTTAIHSHKCWGECKLDWLNKTKCALYLKDLEILTYRQLWGGLS